MRQELGQRRINGEPGRLHLPQTLLDSVSKDLQVNGSRLYEQERMTIARTQSELAHFLQWRIGGRPLIVDSTAEGQYIRGALTAHLLLGIQAHEDRMMLAEMTRDHIQDYLRDNRGRSFDPDRPNPSGNPVVDIEEVNPQLEEVLTRVNHGRNEGAERGAIEVSLLLKRVLTQMPPSTAANSGDGDDWWTE